MLNFHKVQKYEHNIVLTSLDFYCVTLYECLNLKAIRSLLLKMPMKFIVHAMVAMYCLKYIEFILYSAYPTMYKYKIHSFNLTFNNQYEENITRKFKFEIEIMTVLIIIDQMALI